MEENEESAQHYLHHPLLLRADVEEEIKSLSEEVERKRNTRQNILNLPKKISYDCMVPLSKVAFTPGRMVHTNEFSVEVNAKTGARQWMSHVEAAEYLQEQIDRIQEDISKLQHFLNETNKSRISTINSEEMSFFANSDITEKNDNIRHHMMKNQEDIVPCAEDIEKTASIGINEIIEDDDDSWSCSSGEGRGFEIREYYDKDDNILDGQVVDLSKELADVHKASQMNAKQNKSSGNAGVDKLVNDLNDKLTVSNPTGREELDQNAEFIRDLAKISASKRMEGNTNNLDDVFSKLEKQEDEARSSEDAANKGLFSSSKWKKGFLSTPQASGKKVRKNHNRAGSVDDLEISDNFSKDSGPFSLLDSPHDRSDYESGVALKETNGTMDASINHHNELRNCQPKRVSKFKQSRNAKASSAVTSSMTASKTPLMPFTGHIVER